MSVPEQMPIVVYTANGTTTRFPITFDFHDVRYLNVFINKELAPVGSYTVDNFEAVVFNTAPNENDEITLIRDTQLDRETNYQSFDNSFRPAAVNYDFDKIWYVLQEQNLIDGKLLARLKDEIEWRRTHDANFDELSKMRDAQIFSGLKQYLDTIVASVTPNIFDGVTAGIVFAIDGKSVQTHIEYILNELTTGRESIVEEKERAELAESALDQKIDKTEELLSADITAEKQRAMDIESGLQNQINGVGGGNYAYLTYAAMTADTVNIPAKSSVTVTNDSDATKNGIYQYSGTAFTKSTYDPENTLKTWANQNPLFKVKSLTVNDNLNDIKTSGKYKCELSATASTAKNYPFLAAGTLEVVEINATAFFQVYKAYGTFGTAIRTTASDGSWLSWNTYALQADVASQILAAKNAKNLAANLDMNLNDLTEQGVVSVYSDKDITVSNFPEQTQGFLYNYRSGAVC